jgi:hypothetical protein
MAKFVFKPLSLNKKMFNKKNIKINPNKSKVNSVNLNLLKEKKEVNIKNNLIIFF